MRPFLSLLFAACSLTACCDSETGAVSTAAPYNDILPVAAESYSRAYLRVMTAEGVWQKSKDKDIMVCGALGMNVFKPGITVDAAIKIVHGDHFHPSFYNVAVWRPKISALYGVRFGPGRSVEPSVRTLTSSERLLPGDVIIILEKMVSF